MISWLTNWQWIKHQGPKQGKFPEFSSLNNHYLPVVLYLELRTCEISSSRVSKSIGIVIVQNLSRQPYCGGFIGLSFPVVSGRHTLTADLDIPSSFYIFLSPPFKYSLSLWCMSGVSDVSLGSGYLIIIWFLHFDQLWFSAMISYGCKKKHLW